MSAPRALESTVPLPKEWSTFVKCGILHVIGLARLALIDVRAGFASGPRDAKIASLVASLHVEIAQLREELRTKDTRMDRLDPRKRLISRDERLAILELRTARGWTAETARRFLINAATIASWFVRRDEAGDAARYAVPERVLDWCRGAGVKARFGAVHSEADVHPHAGLSSSARRARAAWREGFMRNGRWACVATPIGLQFLAAKDRWRRSG